MQWSPSEESRFERYKKSVAKLGQREGDAGKIAAAKLERERDSNDRPVAKGSDAGNGRKPLEHRTIEELYLLARQRNVPVSGSMNKAELIDALTRETTR